MIICLEDQPKQHISGIIEQTRLQRMANKKFTFESLNAFFSTSNTMDLGGCYTGQHNCVSLSSSVIFFLCRKGILTICHYNKFP